MSMTQAGPEGGEEVADMGAFRGSILTILSHSGGSKPNEK